MYQLPLVFFKCSNDTALCATRVVAMTSTSAYQARQTFKQEKKSGTLLNASGRAKTKTLIYLDNGTVIASPLTMRRLLTSIEKADSKNTDKKIPRNTNGIKVTIHERDMDDFDIDGEELDLDINEDIDEIEEFEGTENIEDLEYEEEYEEDEDEYNFFEDNSEDDLK